MARLHDKGYLDRQREGKAYVYEGSGPTDFLRDRVAETVRDAYDEHGDLALAGFREGLDEEARADLRRLLDED
jgi:predicted transcriptional regulator